MKTTVIDISKFRRDDRFYDSFPILITIKNFDLESIRKRYLLSREQKNNRIGSVERREPGLGGIASVTIENGKINNQEIFLRLKEPRGIDLMDGKFAIAAENTVYILSGDKVSTISDPWFSYIHTVQFSPHDPSRLLISSSGFDCFFEFNWINGEKLFEWYAWEHGINQAMDPETGEYLILTRQPDTFKSLQLAGKNAKLIEHPEGTYLPTATRAAFINSVNYDTGNKNAFIATFFHHGEIRHIHRNTEENEILIPDLHSPHGGRRFKNGFMATSTRSGEIVISDAHDKTIYSLSSLSGKPTELNNLEWVQNAIFRNGDILAIDSNRTSFIIFNPEKEVYSIIPYDPNWAIQDGVTGNLSSVQRGLLESIN